MLNTICKRTEHFIQQMPKVQRKEYGQFFTSKETARYMASLFNLPLQKREIHILDKPLNKSLHIVNSVLTSVVKRNLENESDKRFVSTMGLLIDLAIDFFIAPK